MVRTQLHTIHACLHEHDWIQVWQTELNGEIHVDSKKITSGTQQCIRSFCVNPKVAWSFTTKIHIVVGQFDWNETY